MYITFKGGCSTKLSFSHFFCLIYLDLDLDLAVTWTALHCLLLDNTVCLVLPGCLKSCYCLVSKFLRNPYCLTVCLVVHPPPPPTNVIFLILCIYISIWHGKVKSECVHNLFVIFELCTLFRIPSDQLLFDSYCSTVSINCIGCIWFD